MDDNLKMADLLLKNIDKTPQYYEELYPKRNLGENAKVTRFAPSPTGFLHMGSLFAAFVAMETAKSTGGVFYLRIEDTDKKREVENGVSCIVNGLKEYGIESDEGMLNETESYGSYGPYIQSERNEIYQSYVKSLIQKGLAYPCFMSEDEIAEIRDKQAQNKELPGIYGEYAKYRNISPDEANERIKNGEEYVIRLLSPGKIGDRVTFVDGIKGEIEMDANILDIVLLKKDGTPTYHFAHVIDDHLMRTTDVTRGDEWISSTPIHLQLFDILGFEAPRYAHISPIMKEDEETQGKRKLSKRKDPEAAVEFYQKSGYPYEVVLEYLLTIANSNYEEWRIENPDASRDEFEFSLSKMSKAGALFDLVKLNDISKNYISKMSAEEVYERCCQWAELNDKKLYELLIDDEEYAKAIFAIERGNEKPRKDIGKWEDVRNYVSYFYDDLRDKSLDFADNLSNEDMIEILQKYSQIYDENESAQEWFPKVRELAISLGYAKAPKEYKKNPDEFKGHVGDVASVIRVAVTGRRNTPDLYEILQTLGVDEVMKRFNYAIDKLR